MVEPQETKMGELEALCAAYPGLEVANALLGAQAADQVRFYQNDTASSVLPDACRDDARSRNLPMTTLDALQGQSAFPAPDFIKLDVQGYEIEVLRGGELALASAEAVQMEVNLIPIYEGAPLAHEAVEYMADRGFRVYDVGTFFRRPYDAALWQMDMIFVKSSSPFVASTRWS
jgi:FkbM family methyltransferase